MDKCAACQSQMIASLCDLAITFASLHNGNIKNTLISCIP